ncbi:hypothetical protein PQR57_23240 [Paraburkholderia dipogonis]|uniref:Alpha/beta hydrolase n=1 Tax=Paraburkholderia dipogonis TaxID=1211383 RepID=A0ABW9ATN1_9BURK
MAEIVLVHGIDQQQQTADSLENIWIPALAGGVRIAGFEDVADLIADQSGARRLKTKMAFYGNLFLKKDQQGDDPGEFSDAEAAFAEQLALEWLTNAANRAKDPKTFDSANRELRVVASLLEEEQGTGSAARTAINSLAKIRWFAPVAMSIAERYVRKSLAQVTRYFLDSAIREAAVGEVIKLIGPETKVVVSHSLGSVVAYEAIQMSSHGLPLLITLGSPLGLQTIIYQRLHPQPPTYPVNLKRWVNVADREDFIAAEPNLKGMFGRTVPEGAVFEDDYTVDNGAEPHRSGFYLGKAEVGRAVGQTLSVQ